MAESIDRAKTHHSKVLKTEVQQAYDKISDLYNKMNEL